MDDLLKSKNLFSVSFGFFFFYFQLRPSDRQLWSSSARPTSAARGAPTATLPPTALGRFPASLPTACTTSTTSSVRSATPTSSPPPTERWGTVKRNLKKKYVSTAVEKKTFQTPLKMFQSVPIIVVYILFIFVCCLLLLRKNKTTQFLQLFYYCSLDLVTALKYSTMHYLVHHQYIRFPKLLLPIFKHDVWIGLRSSLEQQ